jgi:hypothetical protein
MDWIDMAEDRDRWRAVVSAVMNFQFYKMQGTSRLAEDLLASQEGLSSMELVNWLVCWSVSCSVSQSVS